MIRRIILFLWLLLVVFFVYRRYNQPAADTLLYKVRTLSFNKSTYTTSIDGVTLSTSGNLDTKDTIWSLLLSRNATIATLIAIGSQTTGSLSPINLTPIQEDQAIDQIIGRVIEKNQPDSKISYKTSHQYHVPNAIKLDSLHLLSKK